MTRKWRFARLMSASRLVVPFIVKVMHGLFVFWFSCFCYCWFKGELQGLNKYYEADEK